MKTVLASALAASACAVALSALAPSAEAQRWGGGSGPGVIHLYEDARFQGRSIRLDGEAPNLQRLNFNDRISSFRIEGDGQWEVCMDADYRGNCQVVEGDNPDMSRWSFNDQISSVRPLSARGPEGRGGLTLYTGPNYTGRAYNVDSDTSNLRNSGFNDLARSARVRAGSWTLCQHADYGGRCETIRSDVSDLSRFGLDREVSSVSREGRGGWGPGGPGGPGRPGGGGDRRIEGGVDGQASIFFPRPQIGGYPVSACVDSRGGSSCGRQAADQLCRQTRYSRAAHYSVDRRGGQAWSIGERRPSQSRETLVDVLCVR